ncbi:MAG: TonB-dependent receptor [Gemmatimonadaceae bacterium]|nr:TonB-dependent receptor [Gemmatimonadaceae bacterium]
MKTDKFTIARRLEYVVLGATLIGSMTSISSRAFAQGGAAGEAHITGQVTEASTSRPLVGVSVTLEGTRVGATTDSTGSFRIGRAPAGPQVLRAQRIGYAPTRINIVVPATGELRRNIAMAKHALELTGITVTADPASRARGELGTASVIEQEAIKNQTAASLSGILELLPGVPLQAPGLDNVQQISLRAVPISGGDPGSSDRSAQQLAAFGTLIILDGVPLSNNANLQSLGSRAELGFSSSAGGGIDLRRIPATTIERVEVIRGIPSARFGDLTQGAIIIDTRAGVIPPEASLRADAQTTEASIVGGTRLGPHQTGSVTADLARTRVPSGTRDDQATHFSSQLAHRAIFGQRTGESVLDGSPLDARLVLDTRADFFQLLDQRPEQAALPGMESRSRDSGLRISERARLRIGQRSRLELTGAFDAGRQESFSRQNKLRSTTPVTNRTTPGREIGRYVAGIYNARVNVDGKPQMFYTRAELSSPRDMLGFSHDIRLGGELRREVNSGAGYQFDIEFPPQDQFNGARGFARPRTYAEIPALATSAFYLDDRLSRSFASGMLLNIQGGVRADVLHQGGTWAPGSRDGVIQPRLNAELAPRPWLRLRAGAGRVAKLPSLDDLYPALQYYDVINVNFFANNPAERLAVLTTSTFDPGNPDLHYSIADKAEAGLEMRFGRGGNLSFVAFREKLTGGVGIRAEPTFLLREHFTLTNTAPGSGKPPVIVEPASSVDSVPVLIDRRANNLDQTSSGFELTAGLPEITPIRTRVEFQSALVKSRLDKDGLEFAGNFDEFQIAQNQPRSPYYDPIARTGQRLLLATRVIHHQPAVGLALTGTIQHTLRDRKQNIGRTDTLSFVGYVTRGGSLVPVPETEKNRPEFFTIRIPRRNVIAAGQNGASDWLFSFQAAKTLPLDGRLSFYAFNAFDKIGRFGGGGRAPNFYQSTRFGLEVTMPLEALFAWR